MGTKGISMVTVDVGALLDLMNKALADEWLAYYQYWIGARVVKGLGRDSAVTELEEHAADELRHADMLVVRINQLGGTPILNPKEWFEKTNCGYDAPTDPYIKKVVAQNIKGEQCAIDTYKNMVDMTKDKDDITYNMALSILADEIEHEDDLQTLMEDLELG